MIQKSFPDFRRCSRLTQLAQQEDLAAILERIAKGDDTKVDWQRLRDCLTRAIALLNQQQQKKQNRC